MKSENFELYKNCKKEITHGIEHEVVEFARKNGYSSVFRCSIPGLSGCVWTCDNSH